MDLIGAARVVLRDWNSSKFARYTTPLTAPPTKSSLGVDSVSSSFLPLLYAKDEEILLFLATRKEIRRKGGLVKLSPSEVEERKATLEEAWIFTEDDEDESGDDVEGENDASTNMVLDDEKEEEEPSEGEDKGQEDGNEDGNEDGESSPDSEFENDKATPAAQSRKQKRKRGSESLAPRPAKRVSVNPVISSTKGKKVRLLSHPNPKVKNKLPSAAVPRVVTTPKSILKKAGANVEGRKEVTNKYLQVQTGKSKKDGG